MYSAFFLRIQPFGLELKNADYRAGRSPDAEERVAIG
jgi:hypothetical protein